MSSATINPIIRQIRALQQSDRDLWIELSNGRLIQVYAAKTSLATTDSIIGILDGDGFDLIQANQVVSVGGGFHAKEVERREKRKAEAQKLFGSE